MGEGGDSTGRFDVFRVVERKIMSGGKGISPLALAQKGVFNSHGPSGGNGIERREYVRSLIAPFFGAWLGVCTRGLSISLKYGGGTQAQGMLAGSRKLKIGHRELFTVV